MGNEVETVVVEHETLVIPVPEIFAPYLPSALTRLSYNMPEIDISPGDNCSAVSAQFAAGTVTPEYLRKQLNFLLYRERILSETLAIRKRLYTDE